MDTRCTCGHKHMTDSDSIYDDTRIPIVEDECSYDCGCSYFTPLYPDMED